MTPFGPPAEWCCPGTSSLRVFADFTVGFRRVGVSGPPSVCHPLVERVEPRRDDLGALEVALSGVPHEPFAQYVQRLFWSA